MTRLILWCAMGVPLAAQEIEPVRSSVTVAERIEAETPAPPEVLKQDAVRRLPGVNLDDRLRLLPGFSLFRRSGSLTANPTTQGVNLRGLGSTGASRSLVLWDGVPVNSPFGGWVYWTRIPPVALDRIEVTRSASTSVFGDRAMGGAIQFQAAENSTPQMTFGYEGGNYNSRELTGYGATGLGKGWSVSAAGRAFTTDGWFIVPGDYRGAVDTPANVRFAGGLFRADWTGRADRLFLRIDLLSEERDNGTQLQRNSTSLGTLAANYTRQIGASWALSGLAFHNREELRASFTAVAADRATERLTTLQSVPAEGTGGAGYVRRSGASWNLLAGGDAHRAEGYSRETVFPAGYRVGGGVQTQYGLFAQSDAKVGFARLYGGIRRHDTGTSVFWSPSGGVAAGFGAWRLYASANKAFRAPTLNEMFRDFRAGNALTLANPSLLPETLGGLESGVSWNQERWRVSLSGYWNQLDDLIVNVTRSSTPQLITRQRDNAGAARVRGVETSVSGRWRNWLAEASYLLADSRFEDGRRLPQIPRHQGSAMLTWQREATMLTGGIRATSLQFEDDLNRFPLPGFAVWHLAARQSFGMGLWATFVMENAFDREVIAGYSPTPLLGSPRLIRGGLRWEWRKK